MQKSLSDSLITNLEIVKPGIISFVGAGGKTSLMFRIAEELSTNYDRILITTTTKMFPPDNDALPLIISDSLEQLLSRARRPGKHSNLTIAANEYCSKTNKLIGFSPEFVDNVKQSGEFDWILTEADGSARKPIKAPADHEPALPRNTLYLLGIIGLSSLGRKINAKHVHRVELFKQITGLTTGQPITPEAISCLISHPAGLFKNRPVEAKTIAFLNQYDTLEASYSTEEIINKLQKVPHNAADMIVIGQAHRPPVIEKVWKPQVER